MTAEELLQARISNQRSELIEGVLMVREPAGYAHGRVTMNLTARLLAHLDRHPTGRLFAAATGFRIARDPDTVRAADITYIRNERLPQGDPPGYPDLAPDLVVEVLSPEERTREIQRGAGHWLKGGTLLVWVVDPRRATTHIYRCDGTEEFVGTDGSLNGEDILPGFTCVLAEIM